MQSMSSFIMLTFHFSLMTQLFMNRIHFWNGGFVISYRMYWYHAFFSDSAHIQTCWWKVICDIHGTIYTYTWQHCFWMSNMKKSNLEKIAFSAKQTKLPLGSAHFISMGGEGWSISQKKSLRPIFCWKISLFLTSYLWKMAHRMFF